VRTVVLTCQAMCITFPSEMLSKRYTIFLAVRRNMWLVLCCLPHARDSFTRFDSEMLVVESMTSIPFQYDNVFAPLCDGGGGGGDLHPLRSERGGGGELHPLIYERPIGSW
jgi:hypothetical protein